MCYVLYREVVAKKENFVVLRANRRILVTSSPPSTKSWTNLTHYQLLAIYFPY